MQFLSDVYLRCPDCDGKRYRPETLEIRCEGADGRASQHRRRARHDRHRGAGVLQRQFECRVRLQPLVDVGLEYVKLGQPVPTLSGGEAQRLKLAGHLAEAAADDTPSIRGKLFLFDEPTTGLHFDDVAKLLRAFRKLLKIGPLAAGDRTQPRRDPRGRLADRPRARGRRWRRRDRGRRHAGRR